MDLYRIIKRPEDYPDMNISSLGRNVYDELGRLVFRLQIKALEESEKCERRGCMCEEECARPYLVAIGEINTRFRTQYTTKLDEIKRTLYQSPSVLVYACRHPDDEK